MRWPIGGAVAPNSTCRQSCKVQRAQRLAAVFVLLSGAMFGFTNWLCPRECSSGSSNVVPHKRVAAIRPCSSWDQQSWCHLHFRTARGCIDLSFKYWRCGARRAAFSSGLGMGVPLMVEAVVTGCREPVFGWIRYGLLVLGCWVWQFGCSNGSCQAPWL